MFAKSTIHAQDLQSNSSSEQDSTPSAQGFSGSGAETCYPEDGDLDAGSDRAAVQRKQSRWRVLGVAARSRVGFDVPMPARKWAAVAVTRVAKSLPELQAALLPRCKPKSRGCDHGSNTILINCWPGYVHILVVFMTSPQPLRFFA